jgi:uncharacterized alkaline shock family protein YloU
MKKHGQLTQIDTKEFELPETLFIQDIDNRVFQSITVRCLAQIEDIALLEGNLIDNWLGRDSLEGIKGIHVEQDDKKQSVAIKVEVNVAYGVSIPAKAEEIHTKLSRLISELSGLHVGSVHVVFKNLIHAQK